MLCKVSRIPATQPPNFPPIFPCVISARLMHSAGTARWAGKRGAGTEVEGWIWDSSRWPRASGSLFQLPANFDRRAESGFVRSSPGRVVADLPRGDHCCGSLGTASGSRRRGSDESPGFFGGAQWVFRPRMPRSRAGTLGLRRRSGVLCFHSRRAPWGRASGDDGEGGFGRSVGCDGRLGFSCGWRRRSSCARSG